MPWTLIVFGGISLALLTSLGINRAILVATIGLNCAFLVFFLRHFAFAAAAIRWAPRDLYEAVDIDLGDLPTVTILVACHNEALVAEGLARSLLSVWYPREKLQIVVINDNSSDDTGEILDRIAATEPRLRVVHRSPQSTRGKSA